MPLSMKVLARWARLVWGRAVGAESQRSDSRFSLNRYSIRQGGCVTKRSFVTSALGLLLRIWLIALLGITHPAPAALAKTGAVSQSRSAKAKPRSVAGAPSAPTLRLTLPRAIQLAIEKNLAIKVESFNPQIADTRVLTEKGTFDPELRAGFEHDTTRDTNNAEVRTGGFNTSIGGLTSLGSTYSLGVTTTAADYRNQQAGASFSLTQPLLRGFGVNVNLANLRIALNDRRNTEWAFRQEVIDVVTRTIIVYNALYTALRDHDAAVRSRNAALQLQHDEERRMAIGVKTALDVTTARAEAASREEAVLLTQQSIKENERFLKQLVTDSTEALLETAVAIEPPLTPLIGPIDLHRDLRETFHRRPDYQQALVSLRTRHINVVVSRNELLPRLDLVGSLNMLGINSNDASTTFGSLFDSTNEPGSWSAGVTFRLPLPNRSARGKLAGARLRDAQALVDLQRLEQAVIVEVANAAGQIATSRKRIDTNGEALRLAKESLAAGEERLKAGAATTFEVLELQRKLMQAEAAQIKADADYRDAIAEYDQKTGVTLDRNAITLQ